MLSETVFDHSVVVETSRPVIWEQITRLAEAHGTVTGRDFLRWIVSVTGEISHVYHVERLDTSGKRLRIRHLVIPNPNVGQALQLATDTKIALDDIIKGIPQLDDPSAQYRLKLLVNALDSITTVRPPDVGAITPDADAFIHLELASLWARFAANFVDQYALNSVPALTFVILGVLLSHDFRETFIRQSPGVQLLELLPLSMGATILYHWYFLTRHNGQTPGKSLLGIRVVRADHKPITLKTVVIRVIGYVLNGLILFLGWINIFIDHDRRGWHDILAGTVVVRALPDPETTKYERISSETKPRVTWALIVINIIIFFIGNTWGLNNRILVLEEGQYFRLLTSMFLHINFLHLASNMLALYFIGRVVEVDFGSRRFALVYILSGLLGSVTSMLLNDISIFSLGASGAIFAVFGAALVYYHRNRSLLRSDDHRRSRNVLYAVVILLINGFTAVGIDNWAHLGGLVGGILIALLIGPLLVKSSKPDNIDHIVITSNPHGPFRPLVAGTILIAIIFGFQAISMETVPRTFTGGGVTMEYPSNWAGITDFEHTRFSEECNLGFPECLFRAAPHHNLYVEVHRYNGFAFLLVSVEELDVEFWHNLIREIPNVTLISREEIQFDGRSAVKRIFSFGKQTEMILFVKDQSTIVQLHAFGDFIEFEESRDELDAIVDSLHFTDS